MKRSRIGAADLGALVGQVDAAESRAAVQRSHERAKPSPTGEALTEVVLDALRPSPFQPATRGGDDDVSLANLAENVGTHGMLQPLLARRLGDGGLELIAGHRRLAAARQAGLATVPVRIQSDISDLVAQERTLAENLAREDLTPWEEARGIAALRTARLAAGVPSGQRDLARAAGWALGRVSESLAIAEVLTPALVEAVGIDVQILNTLPKTALIAVAREPDMARRQMLLRRAATSATAEGGVEPAARRSKEADATPWSARIAVDRTSSVTLRVPVEALTPDDARQLAARLAPLVKALRERAASRLPKA